MPRNDDDIKIVLNKLYGSQTEIERLITRVPMFGERHRILTKLLSSIQAEIRCMEWMLFPKAYSKRMISDEIREGIEKDYDFSERKAVVQSPVKIDEQSSNH